MDDKLFGKLKKLSSGEISPDAAAKDDQLVELEVVRQEIKKMPKQSSSGAIVFTPGRPDMEERNVWSVDHDKLNEMIKDENEKRAHEQLVNKKIVDRAAQNVVDETIPPVNSQVSKFWRKKAFGLPLTILIPILVGLLLLAIAFLNYQFSWGLLRSQ